MPLEQLQIEIGYKQSLPSLSKGNANTAIVTHAKKTLALIESNIPFNIKVERQNDKVDVKSIGYDDFDG